MEKGSGEKIIGPRAEAQKVFELMQGLYSFLVPAYSVKGNGSITEPRVTISSGQQIPSATLAGQRARKDQELLYREKAVHDADCLLQEAVYERGAPNEGMARILMHRSVQSRLTGSRPYDTLEMTSFKGRRSEGYTIDYLQTQLYFPLLYGEQITLRLHNDNRPFNERTLCMIIDRPYLLLPADVPGPTNQTEKIPDEYVPVELCPEEMDELFQVFTVINDLERGWAV